MRRAMKRILTVLAVLGLGISAFGSLQYTVSDLNAVPGGPIAYGLDLGVMMGESVGAGPAQVLVDGVLMDLNDLIPSESGWDLLSALLVNNVNKQIVGAGSYGGTIEPFLLTLAGDANSDGMVNGTDLGIWQRNFSPLGAAGNGFWTGDWNGDGKVNGIDLGIWQRNFSPLGQTFNLGLPPGEPTGEPIHGPEPMTMALLAISVGLVAPKIRRAMKRA